jgi:predicted DNA-binding transcriptional regulator AlpA
MIHADKSNPAQPIQFTLTITLADPAAQAGISRLLAQAFRSAMPNTLGPVPVVPSAGQSAGPLASSPEPLLWNSGQVAKALQISDRHVWRMCDWGRMPRPARLGNCLRWNAEEIRAWITAGCPAQKK